MAIFGGTFDPVHNGHIEAARKVCGLFALDELIFVPACVPPHKRNAGITSAFHRFAMLALATNDEPRWRVSTIEFFRQRHGVREAAAVHQENIE